MTMNRYSRLTIGLAIAGLISACTISIDEEWKQSMLDCQPKCHPHSVSGLQPNGGCVCDMTKKVVK